MNTDNKKDITGKPNPVTACPNCGKELSSWEQVLLNVDRALMCKGCWYRILLNPFDDQPAPIEPKT